MRNTFTLHQGSLSEKLAQSFNWHTLAGNDRQLPVFFCSSGPSDTGARSLLLQRIRENAPALNQILAGAG
jgi:hypothetical protein